MHFLAFISSCQVGWWILENIPKNSSEKVVPVGRERKRRRQYRSTFPKRASVYICLEAEWGVDMRIYRPLY